MERLAEALRRSVDCGGACHFILLQDSPLDDALVDEPPVELLAGISQWIRAADK